MEWIKVEERLPELKNRGGKCMWSDDVFIQVEDTYSNNKRSIHKGYLTKKGEWAYEWGDPLFDGEKVVSWTTFDDENKSIKKNKPGAGRPKKDDTVTPGLRVNKSKWIEIKNKYPGQINLMFNEWINSL